LRKTNSSSPGKIFYDFGKEVFAVMSQEVLMYNLRFVLRQNQEKRLFLLRKLFEMSMGMPCLVAFSIFEEETGWKDYDIKEAARYLSEEGLLTVRDDGGPNAYPRWPYLYLTHKVIVEVEQSITSPTESTPHFPAPVIRNYNNYYASVGVVQTGHYSTAHSVQNIGVEFPEAFKQTESLRKKIKLLPSDSQEAATQLIGGLEEEFRLSQPRKARVGAFLKELNELTHKISVRKLLASLAKQYDIQL
jgi:hypothetical protein